MFRRTAQRKSRPIAQPAPLVAAAAAIPLLSGLCFAQTNVTWTGASNGSWSTASNWSTGAVPANVGTETFSVFIPDGRIVNYVDVGTSAITDLNLLGYNTTLSIAAGNTLGLDRDVWGPGRIEAVGGIFSALQARPATSVSPAITATGGGQVTLGQTSYRCDLQDHRANRTLLRADGVNALISLPNAVSVNGAAFGNFAAFTYTILAQNSGVIDLSAATSIVGAAQDDDLLKLSVQTGGNIVLTSLASISGRTAFEVGTGSYSLPALQSVGVGGHFALGSGAAISLPQLHSFVGLASRDSGLALGPAATLNAPLLVSIDNADISLGASSTLNAPSLVSITDSDLAILPGRTLVTGTVGSLDYSRVSVAGGASITLPGVTTYRSDWQDYRANRVALSADGAGSSLSLPNLTTLDGAAFGNFAGYTYSIQAINGGVISMPLLTSIVGAAQDDDVLRLAVQGGGNIQFTSLSGTSGRTWFDVGGGTYSLPALHSMASGAHITLGAGAIVNLPLMTTFAGLSSRSSGFVLGAAATINAPALVAIDDALVSLGAGATLNAPALTSLTNSDLALGSGPILNVGTLLNVDHSRLSVTGGRVLDLSGVSSYRCDWIDYRANRTALSADGAGSTIRLPSATYFNGAAYGNFATYTYTVQAINGGLIDLSSLTSIVGAAQADDTLRFLASGGGRIIFGPVHETSGKIRFEVSAGSIEFDDIILNNDTAISITGANSLLRVGGDLDLRALSSATFGAGATVDVAGDFVFGFSDETRMDASAAVVNLNGSTLQTLELGGEDVGPITPTNSGNFGFGQLVVGTEQQANVVQLLDIVNNGNRGVGGDPEALYLFGLGGPDGLRLLSGSVLVIDNLNVYSRENGAWVDLQSLFPPGTTLIPYSDGFLSIDVQSFKIYWTNPASGLWDINTNWTADETPNPVHEVFITPANALTVSGPTGEVRVRSLTVDNAGAGLTTLRLDAGGSLTVSNGLTIGAKGQIELVNGSLDAGSVINGGLLNQSAGRLFTTLLLNSGTLSSAGSLTVSGQLQNSGIYTQSAGTAALGSIQGTGQTHVLTGATVTADRIRENELHVAGRINLRADGAISGPSIVQLLDVSGAGQIDLSDNALIVDYSATSPVAQIKTWIQTGHNSGAWNGLGLLTSLGSATIGLGYADNAALGLSQFDGEPVDATSVLIKPTYYGDTNLDGQVDITDLGNLATSWQSAGDWVAGDSNYDGFIDITDLGLLATNWQAGVGNPLGPDFAEALAAIHFGSVPEPAGAIALLCLLPGLTSRRGRKLTR